MLWRTWLHQNHRGATLDLPGFIPNLEMVEMQFSDLQVTWTQTSTAMKSVSLHSSDATQELARPRAPRLLSYLTIWQSMYNLRELKRRFAGSQKTVQLRSMFCTPRNTPRGTASVGKRQLASEKDLSYVIHLFEQFNFNFFFFHREEQAHLNEE